MNSVLFHTIVSTSQWRAGLWRMNPEHGTVWTANLLIPPSQRFNPPRIGCFSLPSREPTPNTLDFYRRTLSTPPPVGPPLHITFTPFHPTPHFLDLNCGIKLKQLNSCQSLNDSARLQATLPVDQMKLELTTVRLLCPIGNLLQHPRVRSFSHE